MFLKELLKIVQYLMYVKISRIWDNCKGKKGLPHTDCFYFSDFFLKIHRCIKWYLIGTKLCLESYRSKNKAVVSCSNPLYSITLPTFDVWALVYNK